MLVLVGKSASGKTEAAKLLVTKYQMEKLITCTTRAKRAGEQNDIDYHFLTEEQFLEKIQNDEFIEYQRYNNCYYGSLKSDVSDNKVIILEPLGIQKYKEQGIPFYAIYLDIDKETRFNRMLKRGDGKEKAEERIINDDLVFGFDLLEIADLVISDSNLSIEEITDMIYQAYKRGFRK